MDTQRIALKLLSRLPAGVLRLMTGKPILGRGVPLDPVMQLIWIAGKKQPPLDSMTPAEVRANLESAANSLQADLPATVTVREDAVDTPHGPIPVSIYTPAGKTALPVTLFFHFGGFVIGSRNICHGFCGILADRANTIVVNVEYRLAPEHPFPAPVEDALAAYRWALDHAPDLGSDPERIAVAGDSAGALSAAVICQEGRRRNWQPPRSQLLIYPWLVPYSDLPSYRDFADAYPLTANIMQWFGDHYFRSEEDKTHPWAEPLNEPDLAGLPDAIVITAGLDPLRDEGELYANRLAAAGVPVTHRCYDRLTHSFTMLGGVVPAAQRAALEIAGDLAQRLHG